MTKRLLVFSADPGGADCLSPVLGALPEDVEIHLLSKATATEAFHRGGFAPITVDGLPMEVLEARIEQDAFDGVLTSASSLPEKDMTEKLLWRWAARRGVPSIAVLDQWQCYVERFSGPEGSSRLGYLPTILAVMDPQARDALSGHGFPGDRLHVTGQPALELIGEQVSAARKQRPEASPHLKRVTYFAQPLASLFGARLGYDEYLVLSDLLSVVEAVERTSGCPLELVCKLHPKNDPAGFRAVIEASSAKVTLVQEERSNVDLLAESDLVVGVSTVMLVHAVLSGLPTLSYDPRPDPALNACHAVSVEAAPQATTRDDLERYVRLGLFDPGFRQELIERQARMPTHRRAAQRVARLVEEALRAKV